MSLDLSPQHAAVSDAIERFLEAFRPYDEPLSISTAVDHVVATVSDCALSRKEIADIIAELAVDGGFNVHFDVKY